MITATTLPPPSTPGPVRLPPETARVSFVPAGSGRCRLDGAWWPRSRDLVGELPALIDALDRHVGRVGRITVNRSMWPQVPRRIRAGGRIIRAGWFDAEQDPHTIFAMDARGGHWDLLVVPPACDAATAAGLMRDAARPGNHRTAADMMAAVPVGDAAESVWESEGGTPPGAAGSA